jgi:hypothetical protein
VLASGCHLLNISSTSHTNSLITTTLQQRLHDSLITCKKELSTILTHCFIKLPNQHETKMPFQNYLKVSNLFLILLFSTKTNATILSSPSSRNTNAAPPFNSIILSRFSSIARNVLSTEQVKSRSKKHTPNLFPEIPDYLLDFSRDLTSPCFLVTSTNTTNATEIWVTNSFYNPLGFSNQTAQNITFGFGKNQSLVVSMVYTPGSRKGVGFWAPDFQFNNSHYSTPASNCTLNYDNNGQGNGCVEPFVC